MSDRARVTTVFDADTAPLKGGMKEVEGKAGGLSATFKKVGSSIAAAFSVGAIIAFVKQSVGAFIEFDAAMRSTNTLANQTEEQLSSMTEAVRRLSLVTSKPPTDLAKALYDIHSAGYFAKDALTVLGEAVRAGVAGMTDTKTSAGAMVTILNAYGMSAKDAADVSDVLFKTVKYGITNYELLAQNMGKIVSTAAAAKVPFDELGAAIAAMTKAGVQTDEAITSLNRFMVALMKPTAELTAAFIKHTGETAAATLQTKGLSEVMRVLQAETGGNAEKAVELGFELRTLKAALSLTANEGRFFKTALSEIADEQNRAGAASRSFEEQTKSTAYAMKQMGNDIKLTMEAIGGYVAKGFGGAARFMEWLFTYQETTYTLEETLRKMGKTEAEIAAIVANKARLLAEAKEKQDEVVAAQQEEKALAEAYQKYLDAKAAYHAKELTNQDKVTALKAEQVSLEASLQQMLDSQTGTALEKMNIETRIWAIKTELKPLEAAITEAQKKQIDACEEIAALDKQIADEKERAARATEDILAREQRLADRIKDFQFQQLDDGQKLAALDAERVRLQEEFAKWQQEGAVDTATLLTNRERLQEVEEQIARLSKDQVKAFDDASDVMDDLATASGAFGKNIKDLSQSEIKKLEDNLWAIKRIVDALAGAGGFPALNLPDFSPLNNIPEWARKPDAGFGISNLGLALNKLKLILDGIVAAGGIPTLDISLPDMSKTDVDGLVKILNATSRARFGELSIKLDYPDEGVPIAGIETFRELAASAKIIAAAKGVIWK